MNWNRNFNEVRSTFEWRAAKRLLWWLAYTECHTKSKTKKIFRLENELFVLGVFTEKGAFDMTNPYAANFVACYNRIKELHK